MGMKITRYEDLSKYEPHIAADTAEDGDWIKHGSWDLPTDPEEFSGLLERMGMTLEAFLALPAAQSMPRELRKALGVRVQPFLEKEEEKK